MAVLFVHGVPATSRLWREVIRLVDRDDEVLAVDLPGMAEPEPEGWIPDKDNYVNWLIGQIEAMVERNGGPIHLVGHDWGCLLTLRAASLRPELLRSVAAGNAPIDPRERAAATVPLPRVGEAQDIANGVLFLCTEAANYMTGQELVIDGGMTAGGRPQPRS